MKNRSGITLVELLFVMAIFSIVIGGLVSSYQVMVRQGGREFRRAETSIENNITSTMIERDLIMAGYGLAETYSGTGINPPFPVSVSATENAGAGGSDTLTLMGTALGLNSRAAQGWTYLVDLAAAPTFTSWGDAREDLTSSAVSNDVVVMIEPTTKRLLAYAPANWLFNYRGLNANVTATNGNNSYPFNSQQEGTLLYGLYNTANPPLAPTQPCYAVRYYLQAPGAIPQNCAPNTFSLLRAENLQSANPGNGQPILTCVLDLQVAFGLDMNNDGIIDFWDNGGVQAATYTGVTGPETLNKKLKQVRMYILTQDGNYDSSYTFSNPDPDFAAQTDTIRVGDLHLQGGGVGRNVQLTAAQRKYRWKVISFAVTPRNSR
jgi:hypothetical protein